MCILLLQSCYDQVVEFIGCIACRNVGHGMMIMGKNNYKNNIWNPICFNFLKLHCFVHDYSCFCMESIERHLLELCICVPLDDNEQCSVMLNIV